MFGIRRRPEAPIAARAVGRAVATACAVLLSPTSVLGAPPSCLGTATLTIFVRNLSAAPALNVDVDGELAPDGTPCGGPGAASYQSSFECGADGVACGRIVGLRPGSWVHRLRVTVPGSMPQRQAQRSVLVGDTMTRPSNALVWTAYPKTFDVGTTEADDLWNAVSTAAAYTRCHPGPALITFSPDVFPGSTDPRRIRLVPASPSCAIAERNRCKPNPSPDDCMAEGSPDGRTAGLCVTGDRIVVDALDRHANAGGVVVGVGDCSTQVLRVYGADNVFRGLVFEGARSTASSSSCQADTVSFAGAVSRRNRIEQSLVVGPTCGHGVNADDGAGRAENGDDGANAIVGSRVTAAAGRGVKIARGGVTLVAQSCVHDNRSGGMQSVAGGTLIAVENVVQHNVPGSAQHGLSVAGSTSVSTLLTNGNVVRLAGGRGLSVSDAAEAVFENDYVSDNQFAGVRVETTTSGPLEARPTARFRGVSFVCNRHEALTGTCDPSTADVESRCASAEDCCRDPDGAVDQACLSISRCVPGAFPRGFGCAVSRASGHRSPLVHFGDASDAGRNAFTTNKNTATGANLHVSGVDELVPARGNQWERCGAGSLCDIAAVRDNDVTAIDGMVDLGVPPGPRSLAPVVARVAPVRPVAGQIVRVYGDNFNAIEGNPLDRGNATPNCSELATCDANGSCPTGPCFGGVCPCSIENPVVRQRNLQTGANRIRIKTKGGAVLATVYPDAVTPTMLAFRMPFDCFAPLTLEVSKRDPAGNRIVAVTPLCDASGCADAPANTPCDDGNACTLDDRCDGEGQCVPAAPLMCEGACVTCDPAVGCVPQAAGTVCRPAGGPCDVPETCDGTSAICPADVFAPASTVCRPQMDPCDLDDFCVGGSALCATFDRVKTGSDAVTCAFEREFAVPTCAGSIPRRIVRLFQKARGRITATSSNPRATRARLCSARRNLERALGVGSRAAARRARPLSPTCARDLRAFIEDPLTRIIATGVQCKNR